MLANVQQVGVGHVVGLRDGVDGQVVLQADDKERFACGHGMQIGFGHCAFPRERMGRARHGCQHRQVRCQSRRGCRSGVRDWHGRWRCVGCAQWNEQSLPRQQTVGDEDAIGFRDLLGEKVILQGDAEQVLATLHHMQSQRGIGLLLRESLHSHEPDQQAAHQTADLAFHAAASSIANWSAPSAASASLRIAQDRLIQE